MVVEPVVILPAINKRPRSDPGPIGFFRTRLYDSFASKPNPPLYPPPRRLVASQFQPRLQCAAG